MRRVFYYGTFIDVSEKHTIRSSEIQSIKTSEDEFQLDTDLVVQQFQKSVTSKFGVPAVEPRGPLTKNVFGRKQVFICSSFNDWVPQEMKS